MANWGEVAKADPELTEFGRALIEQFGIAFLATVRKDGSPRIHPVCPMIIQDQLLVGITATSAKRRDLCRDGRYVLHALPGPNDAEFFVRGHAVQINNADTLAVINMIVSANALATQVDIFFELDIELAYLTVYAVCENLGQPVLKSTRRHWPKAFPCL